jgi:arylsulfatase A-like enzyme
MRRTKKSIPGQSVTSRVSSQPLVETTVLFVTTSLFLALVDTLFLPEYLIRYLSPSQRILSLPLCIWGNLIPIALGISFFLAGFKYLYLFQSSGSGKAVKIVSVGALVVGTVVYSSWLSVYTFSGASISASPFRTYFIIGSTICLVFLFLFYFAVIVYRHAGNSFSKTIGLSCLILTTLGVWINREIYPYEYEPLHTFVSIWSILISWLGFRELIGFERFSRALSTRTVGLVGAGAVLYSLSVLYFLSSNAVYPWIIWDATGISRYVTLRIERSADDDIQNQNTDDANFNPVLKPELDSFGVHAKRKERTIQPAPHIILFVMDNVQADHVGAHGYRDRPTTPNIDALAKKGTVFENAYSSFPSTSWFSCALLTGRHVSFFKAGRHRVPPSIFLSSVPHLLKTRDYHLVVRAWFESRLEKDFNPVDYKIDQYYRPLYKNHPLYNKGLINWAELSEKERLDKVKAHLDAADMRGIPAFIWIHAIRPHWRGKRVKFDASRKFPFGRGVTNRYDSAIAATDDWYGRMKAMIEKRGGDRNVVWIVSADHGAGLGRYEEDSGKTLYEVHTRVPLIISAPGYSAKRVSSLVDVPLDLASTVLDFAGIPIPDTYGGLSLLPLMQGIKAKDRIVPLMSGKSWIGAAYRNWKLIQKKNAMTLFDLSTDPMEMQNIADEHPTLVKKLSTFTKSVWQKRHRAQKKN